MTRLPDPSGHRDVALGLCRRGGGTLLVWNARSAQGSAVRFWDLPGGSAEAGESLREALAREWDEEVGWRAHVGDLLFLADGRKRIEGAREPLYTWRAAVFEVAPPPLGVEPRPGPEIERAEWVGDAEVAGRLSAPYHEPLVRFLAGGPRYAEVEWVEGAAAGAPPGGGGGGEGLSGEGRHLCVIAAAAAVGDAALVAWAARAALEDGVPRARLEEALLQVVPYAGFPRALAAFAAARPVLGAAPAAAPEAVASFPSAGAAAFARVYGETAARVREGLAALHPLLPAWTLEHAYGRVLARETLPLPLRELLAVAILAAMGGCDEALLGHARAARRLGASREAVAGAVAVVPASAGAGKRAAARLTIARA